ncbi:MAG: SDR family oxidoreductase [Planctomycetota bacterium]
MTLTPEEDRAAPVVLITGGARRVGRATAIELARRGFRLVIHANSSIDAARALTDDLRAGTHADPTDATALAMDLSDDGAAGRLVEDAIGWRGRLDAVVSSAAIWPSKPLEEETAADARKCFDVNALAPFLLAQQAGLRMAEQPGGGVIITLADIATRFDGQPYPDHAAYHLSKACLPGMTRALAVDLAKRNPRVRVNAVAPGPVVCGGVPGEPEESDDRVEHVRSAALVATDDPTGCGAAEHVAHAIAMLIENPFITGETVAVDGGGRLK